MKAWEGGETGSVKAWEGGETGSVKAWETMHAACSCYSLQYFPILYFASQN